MSTDLKIALVGAGSVVFAKNLLGDLLQFPELAHATISLMDIDAERLAVAERMARKMVARLGVRAQVEATQDRREAVRGARHVICTIQVGGYEPGTTLDFEVPKKYGLRQTIGDTLGIGGIFRGLRTIPVLNAIARDIAAVGAPGCLLLNYTNPMAMACWAVDRAVGVPCVGLCHSVQSTSRRLAGYAGLPYEDVTYQVAGINHMAFFLRFEYRGKDAYPLLFRRSQEPGFGEDKVRFEMMRRTGYFVTESSEHQSEYLPYFIPHGEETIRRFDVPLDEYLRRCESILDTWKSTEAQLLGGDGPIEVSPQTHEYGAFIIHSRETGTPRVVYGNVPNAGLINNLPIGCCVEVPCLVDGTGLQPTHVGNLPPQLAALCQTNVNVQALTVEAALTGKREHIYHAAMLDPNCAATLPLDRIWALCDELLEAHQRHGLLGEFAPTVRGTGRSFAGLGDRTIVEVTADPAGDGSFFVRTSGEEALRGELVLRAWEGGELDRAAIKILPDHGAKTTVALRGAANPAEGLRVTLEGLPDNALAVDWVRPPRRTFRAGTEAPAFEVALAGTPAVWLWVADDGPRLNLRCRVGDSDPQPGKLPWSGSCVELFFAGDERQSPRQFILVPGANGASPALFTPGQERVSDADLRQQGFGTGYEVSLSVPKSRLGLEEGAPAFLLDCYATIHAHGGAHSGGRVSLSGEFQAHLGTAAYARVELLPPRIP